MSQSDNGLSADMKMVGLPQLAEIERKSPSLENHLLMQSYGRLLHMQLGVYPIRVTVRNLILMLDEDVYGLIVTVPKQSRVVAAFHFQIFQTGREKATATPYRVAVDPIYFSDVAARIRLIRTMYETMQVHLLSLWWRGLSPLGYPPLRLVFEPVYDGGKQELYPGRTFLTPYLVDYHYNIDPLLRRCARRR